MHLLPCQLQALNSGSLAWMQSCSLIYDVVGDKWSGDPNAFCLKTPRSDACGGVINGKIYVAGE